jgi:hypothetical protein
MKTKILFLLGLFAFCIGNLETNAQIEKNEAAYIYNFTRLIKWPESQSTGDFIIGVFGKNQPITNELKLSASSRTVGSQPIKVVEYYSVDEIQNCHVLFVPDDQSSQLKKISTKLGNAGTVIITEEPSWNPDESMINLLIIDQKLAFHINKGNADAKKIFISEKLLALSK